MAYEKKAPLTDEERAALKPALKMISDGHHELEQRMAELHRNLDDVDPGGGFCGLDCGCSSFKGPHPTLNARCQREFCRHPYRVHLT
jgi:hypothetical protein